MSSLWLDECFLDNASILFSGSLKKIFNATRIRFCLRKIYKSKTLKGKPLGFPNPCGNKKQNDYSKLDILTSPYGSLNAVSGSLKQNRSVISI